jgi:hypothetical protein
MIGNDGAGVNQDEIWEGFTTIQWSVGRCR